jgi:dihydroflavonol-4-reductase
MAPAAPRAPDIRHVAKPVLVTGASGFVGSAVTRALLAAGRQVRALLRPNSPRANIADLPVELRFGALEDHASLGAALEGCGALFHVAADYRLWVRDPAAMHRANVDGTRALMEAALAAGVERIVYTSSVATLGLTADGSPADETTPSRLEDMIGPYKRSKFLAEEAVKTLVRERALPAVIVNPSTPIGPRDSKPTPTGRMIVEAASGRMPAFVDTGLNLVHVDDVAQGHLAAEARGRIGERYILGGENLSLAEILRRIAALTGRRPPAMRLPIAAVWPVAVAAEAAGRLTGREPFVTLDGLRMARHKMFFSSAKAARELGYAARPADAGLADAVAWFRQAGMCP